MMKLIKGIYQTAFLFLMFFCAAGFAYGQMPVNERIEIFEQVWETINDKYYDANFNGANWTEIGKNYRAQIEKVSDEKSFYAILDRMAGELRDSHTRVYSPEQTAQRKLKQTASVGLTIKEIENTPVVFSVALDSEAARRGVKAGMIVTAINNQPIKTALAEAQKAVGVSSSESASKRRAFSKLTSGEPDTPLTLELENAAGKKQVFELTRRIVSSQPQFVAKSLPSGIAYLKLPQFDEENSRKFEAALEKFKNAPALILDLRGNSGGDGDIGLQIAGRFLPDKITIASLVTRNGKPPLPEIPMTLEVIGTPSKTYANPLVILTDDGTASVSELIANALQEQNRARIFGTPSCGCVLAFLDYKKLKGGGSLTLSEFGFVTAKGKKLEGSGIAPDKIISPTLKDIRAERDAALEEAVKFLGDKSKPRAL